MLTETLLTIAEAAEMTGLTHKAVRNRLDRGQIEYVLQSGVRRIPRSELVRVGLLTGGSEPAASRDEAGSSARLPRTSRRASGRPRVEIEAVVDRLHDRLEHQAIELGRAQLIAEQCQAAGAEEIALLRGEIRALEVEVRLMRSELENAQLRLDSTETPVNTHNSGAGRRRLWSRRGTDKTDTESP